MTAHPDSNAPYDSEKKAEIPESEPGKPLGIDPEKGTTNFGGVLEIDEAGDATAERDVEAGEK